MRVYTDEEKELIKKMYLEGVSYVDIGHALHTDRQKISDLIKTYLESGELEKPRLPGYSMTGKNEGVMSC